RAVPGPHRAGDDPLVALSRNNWCASVHQTAERINPLDEPAATAAITDDPQMPSTVADGRKVSDLIERIAVPAKADPADNAAAHRINLQQAPASAQGGDGEPQPSPACSQSSCGVGRQALYLYRYAHGDFVRPQIDPDKINAAVHGPHGVSYDGHAGDIASVDPGDDRVQVVLDNWRTMWRRLTYVAHHDRSSGQDE